MRFTVMSNLNIPYFAILYVNSCPVGFIDNLGFIKPRFERDCHFFLTSENLLTIPYSPKSDNHESVRIYQSSYFYSNESFDCQFAEKNFLRVDKRIEFLSADVVIQKRKCTARAVGNREKYLSLINND